MNDERLDGRIRAALERDARPLPLSLRRRVASIPARPNPVRSRRGAPRVAAALGTAAAVVVIAGGVLVLATLRGVTDAPAGKIGPSATALGVARPSVAASATPTSSTASAASVVPCDTSALRISTVNTGAAAGTVGGWLRFVNVSDSPCSLHGWPAVVGVTATGATTRARDVDAVLDSPPVKQTPTVVLDPGADAFAAFAGGDTPAGGTASCPPSFTTLRVAAPGSTGSTSLSGWIVGADAYLPACDGLAVTVVMPRAVVPNLSATLDVSPAPSEVVLAHQLVTTYVAHLVAGDTAGAWSMLAAGERARLGSFAAFSTERKAFFASAGSRYTVVAQPSDVGSISDWLATISPVVDVSHAVLVEVRYDALAENNAGWELYIVADLGAAPAIWDVR